MPQGSSVAGKVEASIVVDEQGNVGNVTIIDSPGIGLDEKVTSAVRQWKFKPAMKDGVPVSFQMIVTETFAGH
jgi:protein TonB